MAWVEKDRGLGWEGLGHLQDDGAGIAPRVIAGSGRGLAGMRGRAEEIGATVAWESSPGGGAIVTLDFDPVARGRMPAP